MGGADDSDHQSVSRVSRSSRTTARSNNQLAERRRSNTNGDVAQPDASTSTRAKARKKSNKGNESRKRSQDDEAQPSSPPPRELTRLGVDSSNIQQDELDGEIPQVATEPPVIDSNATGGADAIEAYSVCRAYGRGGKKQMILKHMDLVLPKGKIYGLLGPSGCGKSTFLKCVTGRLRVHDGNLTVLGKKPGAPQHTIPGPALGYMPQEEALYPEFTVNETLRFCSSLHGVTRRDFEKKRTFLYGLLELEGLSDRLIKNLSGGQRRRVSFACALVHTPKLLVLDEPTVGVDPLLRAKIWAYLKHLTSLPNGPSILITTHYIEEARHADVVGMMRDGGMLAEDNPEALLERYSCASLEDVFLLLCRGQGKFSVHDDFVLPKLKKVSIINYDGPSRTVTNKKMITERHDHVEQTLRERLEQFYRERNPENMSNIDAILNKYEGREDDLWQNLLRKYPNVVHVIGDDGLTDRERKLKYDEEKEKQDKVDAELLKEKMKPPAQSNRWKTEKYVDPDASIYTPSVAATIDDAHREQLFGKSGATREGEALLQPKAATGWIPYEPSKQHHGCRCGKNISALVWKNLTKLRRSPGFLAFLFILPALQVSLFCLAIGHDPVHLPVAIFNDDASAASATSASSIYLNSLMTTNTIDNRSAHSRQHGIEQVHQGLAMAYLEIPRNFSSRWDSADLNLFHHLNDVTVQLRLDDSQQQIAFAITLKSNEAYDDLIESFLGNETNAGKASVKNFFKSGGLVNTSDPIYGESHPSFTHFVAPGIMVTITFAQAIGLTAIAFIQDRKDGLLDRCWAAGVRPSEIIIAHTITQFLILCVQVAIMLAIALDAFQLPMNGQLVLPILLMLALGLTGMTYGLFISALANTEVDAMQIAMATIFPVLLLSGVLWPVQGIPSGFRYVTYALPTTWAAEAMRSVMLRGWDISHVNVWAGFVAVIAYALFFTFLASRGIRSVD